MTIDADERRRLVRARAAVFCLFASFGVVIATWAVHLPSVKQATGVSTSLLGTILLILGVGALAGMQLSGVLVDRFGSGPIAVIGVGAMAIALVPPLAVNSWPAAAVGAFFLGVATGIAEVGMNASAVDVERDYRRPIMASFHAVFSIGDVLGALIGAAGFALAVPSFTPHPRVGRGARARPHAVLGLSHRSHSSAEFFDDVFGRAVAPITAALARDSGTVNLAAQASFSKPAASALMCRYDHRAEGG